MIVHIGYLGNGATCYDISRMVHCDHPIVAHISPAGNIRYYEEPDAASREKIERTAAEHRASFIEKFFANPIREQFRLVIDGVPLADFLRYEAEKKPGDTMQDAVDRLWPAYFAAN